MTFWKVSDTRMNCLITEAEIAALGYSLEDLMVSWGDLKPVLVPIMVTIVVTTVLVMAVSGRTAQFVLKKEEKKDE